MDKERQNDAGRHGQKALAEGYLFGVAALEPMARLLIACRLCRAGDQNGYMGMGPRGEVAWIGAEGSSEAWMPRLWLYAGTEKGREVCEPKSLGALMADMPEEARSPCLVAIGYEALRACSAMGPRAMAEAWAAVGARSRGGPLGMGGSETALGFAQAIEWLEVGLLDTEALERLAGDLSEHGQKYDERVMAALEAGALARSAGPGNAGVKNTLRV